MTPTSTTDDTVTASASGDELVDTPYAGAQRRRSDTTLDVVHAPLKVGRKTNPAAIRYATTLGADTIGFTEAYRDQGALGSRPRHNLHTGTLRQGDRRRSAHDVAILTRAEHTPLGSLYRRVSVQVEPTRIAPDRPAVASIFEHPLGTVAHLALHLNWIGDRPDARRPHVRQYAASVTALHRLLRYLDGEAEHLVVTGDVNSPRKAKDWGDSIWELFDVHKLTARDRHLDVIAHGPTLTPAEPLRVLEKGHRRTNSDHPWLIGSYRRR